MPPNIQASSSPFGGLPLRLFALAFGAFLGLAFLKFPNPPVVEHLITAPTAGLEWVFMAWPVRYAYPIVAVLVLAGIVLIHRPLKLPRLVIWLPVVWLAWVWLSRECSMDAALSRQTSTHFVVCVVCFYIGFFVISQLRRPAWFFAGLIGALVLVVVMGWEQHFGGLEASRRHFMLYELPSMPEPPPPEFMKRMGSSRIFSTLFYANSLAGALLLLTPLALGVVADTKAMFTVGARWLLGALIGSSSCLCLVWSGSKAGWLLAVAMVGGCIVKLPVRQRWKLLCVSILIAAGVGGFLVRYLGFLKRGAPSVMERFNYWQAAWQNATMHPLMGSGPGTFVKIYSQTKPPEAEMARLVHNDYLQQASDSGLLAGGLFLAIVLSVLVGGRSVWQRGNWTAFGVWLGLAGLAAQSFVEFGFYVPATAWCWFALAGWILAAPGLEFDNIHSPT